jgi:hypothetical protein
MARQAVTGSVEISRLIAVAASVTELLLPSQVSTGFPRSTAA